MNTSVHKKDDGKIKQARPAALKRQIKKALPANPLKTAKRTKQTKHIKQTKQTDQAKTQAQRALAYAKILSRMVRYDTTSFPYSEEHPASVQLKRYHGYHRLLEELFPLVHEKLEKTDLDGSLLYYWRGQKSIQNSRSGLTDAREKHDGENDRPIVLMGHQDVVPVTDTDWKYPPFSGKITGGRVWGRGSVDTKCSCMAFFQAVEELLREGYVPEQDVYLSTSCTEEWGGPGCPAIVEELRRRGVKPWLVCDEGGGIYTDPMPGVRGNFAMIGIGEKGRANVRFIARGKGGHASTPSRNSPIARLAAFVCAVEKHSPFRSQMELATRAMLEAMSPGAVLPFRVALQHLDLFKKPIELVTPRISGQAAAMLATTITFTMASGSDACNVFPAEATLGANMRFVHHQDMKESLALIRRFAAKYDLEMEVLDAAPCTRLADTGGTAFRYVEETVMRTFPGIPASPYILTAATDAAFYDSLCDNCIRFAPIVYGQEEKKGIHGTNEALRYDCLPGAVDFYRNLITGLVAPDGSSNSSRS